MFVGDRDARSAALESAADLEVVGGLGLQFTAIYAMRLRRRLDAGVLELRDLVDVTVKSHHNGSLNPYAQHRKPMSPAERSRPSRPIAEPLTLLMCSSICRRRRRRGRRRATGRRRHGRPPVAVRAHRRSLRLTPPSRATTRRSPTPARAAPTTRPALGPEDVDVAEVHDAMAPGELLYYEQLGLLRAGRGRRRCCDSGATALGGRLPVNPSGGLCSRGHPVGATGLAQIAELTWQLRGEAGERQAGRPRIAPGPEQRRLDRGRVGRLQRPHPRAGDAMELSARPRGAADRRARRASTARAGALRGIRCQACGEASWPARAICNRCGSTEVAEESFATAGQLLTHTTVWVPRPGLEAGYTLGLVQVADGPSVFTHLRGVPADASVPLAVRLVLGGEGQVPPFWFEPAAADG